MRVAERHADDLARCRAILRAGSKSFHAASLLLPRRVREPASVVYAFCRVADDAVDLVSPRQGPEAVARLRRRLDAVYRDHPDDHPVDRALAVVVARHGIPRAVPDALLEGFDWDVEGRRYDDLSGVLAYSARVASTVGVMMTVLMGQRAPGVIARACDLGAAMQLTNICRDVGEDARNGRVYLPLAWLREADVDIDAWIANPTCTPAIATVTTRLLAEADRLYARADAGVAMLPRDCRSAIRAARLLYADIGRVVLGRGGNSVDARAVVPTWRKLGLLLRASMARLSRSRAPALDAPPPLDEVRFLVDAVARHPTTETLPS